MFDFIKRLFRNDNESKGKYYSEPIENNKEIEESVPLQHNDEKSIEGFTGRFSPELRKKIEESTLQIMTHDLYMHYHTDDIVEDASNPEWQNQALFFWKNNEAFEKKSLPPNFEGL